MNQLDEVKHIFARLFGDFRAVSIQ